MVTLEASQAFDSTAMLPTERFNTSDRLAAKLRELNIDPDTI
ncbi:hypothetical protein [Nostoc sp.]